ncbi:MAG: hypothetical protein C4575_12855 [Desulforudis sp.]|jgi:hypothetical protein|nr:MAG: hypothetical protein C4575_12855 [Desulforudis sp.]
MNIYQQINSKKTAQEAHNLALETSEEMIKQVKAKLVDYKKIKNPNWANVGDLTHIIELLSETLAFLNNEE